MDERLVKVVTVNIYRNWAESFQTFDYITETGKFGRAGAPGCAHRGRCHDVGHRGCSP